MNHKKMGLGLATLALSSVAIAHTSAPYYVAIDAGIFQGVFNSVYRDQTDVIPQNIAETVQQNGYVGGVTAGYRRPFHDNYLLGAELSANLNSHSASYQAGAATAAFSDTTQVKNNFDLTFVPGFMLGSHVEGYAKIGLSYAYLQDNLNSPAGTTPVFVGYSSNKNAFGFAAGLGVRDFISEKVSIFVEGNYHDYGSVSFANYQNFTASYTHSAHVYTYSAVLGAAYHF